MPGGGEEMLHLGLLDVTFSTGEALPVQAKDFGNPANSQLPVLFFCFYWIV